MLTNIDGLIVKKAVMSNRLGALLDAGVQPGMLSAEGRQGLEFVMDFFRKYGKIPEWKTVEDNIPELSEVDDADLKEPVEAMIDQVLQRFRGYTIKKGMLEAESSLKQNKPDDAAKLLSDSIGKAQEATRDSRTSSEELTDDKCIERAAKEYEDLMALNGVPDGLPTPWGPITEHTMGIHPGELWFIVARLKTGKCVDGDTLLPDPATGEWRPIKQVYETRSERGRVVTLDNGKLKGTTPSEYWDTGIKACKEVVTRSGFKLIAPPDDPLLTPGGWVPIEKLVVGNQIAVAAFMPEPEQPEEMPDWEVDLLAGMIAEGGTIGSTPSFTNVDGAILDRMRSALTDVNCELVKHSGHDECDWAIRSTVARTGRYQKTGVRMLLERHGLWGVRSTEKAIPAAVFRLPNASLARFLGLLWSCDGSVQARGDITFGVASQRLVEQVRQLLLRFRISTVLRTKDVKLPDGRPYRSWELVVKGESKGLFKELIPLAGVKAERIKASVGDVRHPTLDYVKAAPELKAEIRAVVQKSGRTWAEFWLWAGWASNADGHRSSGIRGLINMTTGKIPRTRLAKFAEFFGWNRGKELASKDVWWDEIVQINDVGRRHVYDLTVDGSHNFVAGGAIAHNTWVLTLFAKAVWEAGHDVLFVSMEMKPARIRKRFHAMAGKFPWEDFRRGRLNPEVKQRIRPFLETLKNKPKFWIYGSDRVRKPRDLETLIEEKKPKLVIVDGLYFMTGKGEAGWEKINDAVMELQRIAIRKNVPVVSSTQFNKKVGKEEMEADAGNVGYSYGIAQAADALIGIYRPPEMDELGQFKIDLIEARDCPKISLVAKFDLVGYDFSEILVTGGDSPSTASPPSNDPMLAAIPRAEKEAGGLSTGPTQVEY